MPTTTDLGPPSGGGYRKPIVQGRVDIDGAGDLAHWLKVFDTTHEKLLEAIAAVGDDAAAVSEFLRRGSDAEPTPTPQIPDGG